MVATEQSARRRSAGLDWFAFFMADIQTGWGPFVAAYLTSVGWAQLDIGLIFTIGTLTALAFEIPAGALVDHVGDKRRLAALGIASISGSAVAGRPVPCRRSNRHNCALNGPMAFKGSRAKARAAAAVFLARCYIQVTGVNTEKSADASGRGGNSAKARAGSGVHGFEEFAVSLGVAQLVKQGIDGIHGAHGIQDAAQDVHFLELIRLQQHGLAGAPRGSH
jgi:hypothetical protein